MEISLLAKGSGSDPYTVSFIVENNKLKAFCDCRAGMFGTLCKHVTELIAGDPERLFDPKQENDLNRVQAFVAKAPAAHEAARNIAEAEKVIRRKQAEVKSIKKDFGKSLTKGIPIENDES